jgi:hypothetical protein
LPTWTLGAQNGRTGGLLKKAALSNWLLKKENESSGE